MVRAGRLTPDLRRWIIAQAEAGHPAEVMLKSMTDAGWTEAAALDALESTLRLKAAEIDSRRLPGGRRRSRSQKIELLIRRIFGKSSEPSEAR